MTDTISPVGRPIRSFVLRQGRMSIAQQRAYDQLQSVYGITYTPQAIDLNATYQRSAPKILEIGFGMGDATATIAAEHAENDYLGIEVHGPGVGSLLNQIEQRELHNLRIIQHDAVEVLRDMIPDASLAGVHIFFPDPWHKKRHNKRRLIKPEFVALISQKLAPNGYLHCATDWEDYAIQILQVLSDEPTLTNTATDYAPRPDYRPLTKFEQRGIRLGHGVWDIVFRKVS
ncbi:MAG: tRNA (guanosine(46)-N7)-methyltransferase TrmB [Sulfuriferula sp.]|nr:tRNA (guanosine(46)-N7)-methyltransferase TrmB [Sulfuriferula sp.]